MSTEYTSDGYDFNCVIRSFEKLTPENLDRVARLPARQTFFILEDRELDREDLYLHKLQGGPGVFHRETVEAILRPADLVVLSCGGLTRDGAAEYNRMLQTARRVVAVMTYMCRIDHWSRAIRPIMRPDAALFLGILPSPALTPTLDERAFHPSFRIDWSRRDGLETIQ